MTRFVVVEFEVDESLDEVSTADLFDLGDRIASELSADLGAVLTYMETRIRDDQPIVWDGAR